MMNEDQTLPPSERPAHPGELLGRVLMRNFNISKTELASASGIAPALLERVIGGMQPLTPELAKQVDTVFRGMGDRLLRHQAVSDFYAAHGRRPTRIERQNLTVARIPN